MFVGKESDGPVPRKLLFLFLPRLLAGCWTAKKLIEKMEEEKKSYLMQKSKKIVRVYCLVFDSWTDEFNLLLVATSFNTNSDGTDRIKID